MQTIPIRVKESVRLEKYRNDELIEFVNGSFNTDIERSAAWAMFAKLCENEEVSRLVRGRLVEVEEE